MVSRDTSAQALAQQLTDMVKRIEQLEYAQRTTQLQNASVHGNRPLKFYDQNGNIRQTIGALPDGTFGLGAANGAAPPRPTSPIVVSTSHGLAITWNGLFSSARPGDFRDISIHVSSAGSGFVPTDVNKVASLSRSGTYIAGPLTPGIDYWVKFLAWNTSGEESDVSLTAGPYQPLQVVAEAVINGIVDQLALADNAVTEAKIAAQAITETKIANDAITSPKIVADAIQAVHMAVDSILADNIVSGAVTASKIAALAVESAHIAANAINAGHLQAGIITADKLAAIIVLAGQVIVGDPEASRLVLDAAGLTQYDEDGNIVTQFGANPMGGNFLTIVDPEQTQTALASISSTGDIACQDLTVGGKLILNGLEASVEFDNRPKGVVAVGQLYYSAEYWTNSEQGFFEMEIPTEPGRMYRVMSNMLSDDDPDAAGEAELLIRYTTDGSRPTVTSPIQTASFRRNKFGGHSFMFVISGSDVTSNRFRFLVTMHAITSVYHRPWTLGDNGWVVLAEDIGRIIQQSAIKSIGGGGGSPPPPPTATYVKQWPAVWTACWGQLGSAVPNDILQGFYLTHNFTMLGFDDPDIRSVLSGATINAIAVYLTSYHWYSSAGGYVRLGTHNVTGFPGSYSNTGLNRVQEHMNKPDSKWIMLPNAIGNELRDNTNKGLVIDHAGDTSLNFYGRFRAAGQPGGPVLSITYTK
ncbi:MAG: chitobiase/beta-hexosaminidase C-terminal domain-containing protein [Candidatus Cloacimonetes bacterium]|nr:chitobiase/beta-hexosaminidase C-terminal domain-containing protein [Candidatus Cloacimonadota bacterium]